MTPDSQVGRGPIGVGRRSWVVPTSGARCGSCPRLRGVTVRGRVVVAAVALMLLVLVGGCSSGPSLSRSDAEAEGWVWGLTVDSGTMVCESGIAEPAIGFRPDGSDLVYALTEDAVADAQVVQDSEFTAGQLGDIWDGVKPFRPFLSAAWKACDWDYGSDRDAEIVMGNSYQSE